MLSPFNKDPFSDFDKRFDRAQSQMGRFAILGTLLSLLVYGVLIAAIVFAVLYVHRNW